MYKNFCKPISGKQTGAEASWCTPCPAVEILRAPELAGGMEMLQLGQSCGSTDSSARAHGLLSHLGSVPRCWPRRSSEDCSRGAGHERGGDGEESRTGGGSNLRVVCSNLKTEGNWVIVPLIHLITGQSSSLVR